MGKIPLTNAELVKALFLNSSNFNDANQDALRIKQLQIASKWDAIEEDLQNDEIWYFITNDEGKNYSTRIEYLLEMIIRKEEITEDDPYATFRYFSKKFKEKETTITEVERSRNQGEKIIDENWKKIKNIYQTIKDWYADKELFHKVGYLVAVEKSSIKTLKTLYGESKDETKTKTEFKEGLDEKIKCSLVVKNVGCLKKLSYDKEKGIIKNALLLHNVETMIRNKNSTARFPFDKYKKEKWDIEHINATNEKLPQNENDQAQWLKSIEVFCKGFKYPLNNEEGNNQEGDCISSMIEEEETKSDPKKYKFKEEFKKKFEKEVVPFEDIVNAIKTCLIADSKKDEENNSEENMDGDNNSIANLCLLDSHTNRSYGNSLFPVKRKTIIKNEREGTFIPICTKNVFLKLYSSTVTQMSYWKSEEQKAYLADIKEKLEPYLPKQTGENNAPQGAGE